MKYFEKHHCSPQNEGESWQEYILLKTFFPLMNTVGSLDITFTFCPSLLILGYKFVKLFNRIKEIL